MDNNQYLQAYENKITIADDSRLINSNLYTKLAKDDTGVKMGTGYFLVKFEK